MKRALQFSGITFVIWLVAAAAVSILKEGTTAPLSERPTLVVSALAATVVLLPALLALLLNDLLERGPAETLVVGTLMGISLRLLLTLVLILAVDQLLLPRLAAAFHPPPAPPEGQPPQAAGATGWGPSPFLVWALFFYLATLALTTILIIVSPSRAPSPSQRPEDPGAQHPSHVA